MPFLSNWALQFCPPFQGVEAAFMNFKALDINVISEKNFARFTQLQGTIKEECVRSTSWVSLSLRISKLGHRTRFFHLRYFHHKYQIHCDVCTLPTPIQERTEQWQNAWGQFFPILHPIFIKETLSSLCQEAGGYSTTLLFTRWNIWNGFVKGLGFGARLTLLRLWRGSYTNFLHEDLKRTTENRHTFFPFYPILPLSVLLSRLGTWPQTFSFEMLLSVT